MTSRRVIRYRDRYEPGPLLEARRACVSFYLTCSDYGRRVNSSTPIVSEEEIKAKFRFGMDDLLKSG